MSITEARNGIGYTHEDMSRLVGISINHEYNVEAYITIPSVVIALRFARILGRSVEELFSEDRYRADMLEPRRRSRQGSGKTV